MFFSWRKVLIKDFSHKHITDQPHKKSIFLHKKMFYSA